MEKALKILFLTRGNASRGEMAEGFLRKFAGDKFTASSAGTEGVNVSPLAIEVMCEAGIDISEQQPSSIRALFQQSFQVVVSLCDSRRERFPVYPFARKALRWSVPDPELVLGSAEIKKEAFRRVRDQLKKEVERFAGVNHWGDDGSGSRLAA